MNEHLRVPHGTKVTDLPWAERQLIIVVDEAVAEAAARAEAEARTGNGAVDWARVGALSVSLLPGVLVFEITRAVLAAWSKARQAGLKVLQVPRSQASLITFPPGHPRDGVVYAAHPAQDNVYGTLGQFHRTTLEHKFAEAIDLLMALGATEIKAEHVKGKKLDFSATAAIPVEPGTGASLGASAGRTTAESSRVLFSASLSGSSSPFLPQGLVWYPHERLWQTISKGRLEHGLSAFTMTVSYEDDFGINGNLKAGVEKAGLEIGGKHIATVWQLSGTFCRTA